MQFAEIAARNAIKIPVEKRFGPNWYLNHKFINILPKRMKDELAQAEKQERKKRGAALNQDHIVASLSFGFWVALMTSAYDNLVSRTKCNWVERFGKDLVRCFVSKSLSGTIIEKSLDFSKFRITDG